MRLVVPAFMVLATFVLPACGAGSEPPDASHSDARHDGVIADTFVESPTDILSIVVEPADATVTCVNGAHGVDPQYHAFGLRRDGMRTPLTTAVFTLPDNRLGSVTTDGAFTANGIDGGNTQVHVEAAAGPHGAVLNATANLTVTIQRDITVTGAPTDAATRFTGATAMTDASREIALLYPLDGALMPNNVAPPDLQWDRGAAGDLYRVRITKTHLAITAYLVHTGSGFTYDWSVDRDAWRSVAETDIDESASIAVDRFETASSSVITGPAIHVRLTHGGIYGAVYYFDFALGRENRIDPDTNARTDLIPNPPITTTRHDRCLGCHTVSRDGRYLAASAGGDGANTMVFDLTADLTPDPAPTLFPPTSVTYGYFFAFSPDSSQLLMADHHGVFSLMDPHSGASVAATGFPTSPATHPDWSPDGASIAFVQPTSTFDGDTFTASDLAILPRTGPNAFGAPRMIHHGADLSSAPEGGDTDAHPNWSPDGHWITFAHGTSSFSYSNDTVVPVAANPSGLYIVAAAGGPPIRLERALGGTNNSYWPTFSPFITVEPTETTAYFWLAFGTRRDYGNAQAGTRGTGRQQLWVTAIRITSLGTIDPSGVPYWLPGQNTATSNFGAYWGAAPCRANGADCSLSSQCCSSQCLPDHPGSTHTICAPVTGQCRQSGQTCGAGGDCCAGLSCSANVCLLPPG